MAVPKFVEVWWLGFFERAALLKRRTELLANIPYARGIFRRHDLLNKRTANCLKRIRLQAPESAS
jgi:hypothetical protein